MYLPRALTKKILSRIKNSSKAILIYGARQVGKTTLVKNIVSELKLRTLFINADESKYHDVLSSRNLNQLKSLTEGYELLILDEAQRIPDIGINLKIIIDQVPSLKIIATGSSSFDLANKVNEPLTGRSWNYVLYPISVTELREIYNSFEINDKLEELLIYGGYPEILTTINSNQKQELLKTISQSYLYKDILELEEIKHSQKIYDLLKLIAYQIGSEVSISELSNSLDISRSSINRYLDLLEKSFVIFRLSGFNRNLRKEVSKMDKIYFYDLGIRNAIIDNFKPVKDRNDVGQLWENFLIIERKKQLSYENIYSSSYFWRVHTGGELDYLEEKGGNLFGFEFKFSSKKFKKPKEFLKTYSSAKINIVNKDNYLEFTGINRRAAS